MRAIEPLRPALGLFWPQTLGFKLQRIGFEAGGTETIGRAAFRRQRQAEILARAPTGPTGCAGKSRAAALASHGPIGTFFDVSHGPGILDAFVSVRVSHPSPTGSGSVNRFSSKSRKAKRSINRSGHRFLTWIFCNDNAEPIKEF